MPKSVGLKRRNKHSAEVQSVRVGRLWRWVVWGGSVQGTATPSGWVTAQGVLWGVLPGVSCDMQAAVFVGQDAGVAPTPPFDSLQEEHLKAIKAQNKASAE